MKTRKRTKEEEEEENDESWAEDYNHPYWDKIDPHANMS